MAGPCPTTERLALALRGTQSFDDDADLAGHLAGCSACRAQLETLAGGSSWVEAKARTHTPTPTRASPELDQAMRALESLRDEVSTELMPPKLDFLRPSDKPGVLGQFGSYTVLEYIASGGMGIVLKARDPSLDRIVAHKILLPALAANALARARFVREARAAAAVVHEHVVPIYAVDEIDGLPYLVMQFVKGRSLAVRIRATGALRLEEILRIGAQTASGLAAAHAQGLIHRDVKPGNILLENSVERVKLTDFGLARAVDDTSLTRTGELAGTPEFMSPEQAGNSTVDHRSDLFSLGSVLYAMCTGCSPFQATSVIAAVRKVCDEQPPPVHEINAAIPHWLSDIVARLMVKAPAERFQSAREVGELLERYLARVQRGELAGLPGSARPLRTSPRARRQIAVGATAVLAVIVALFFILRNRDAATSDFSSGTSLREGRGITVKASPSGSLQEPFVVLSESGTNLGGLARIEDAVAAAPPGAVIELCWTGPREINPVILPPKPLTLRAGRGFQPVWNSLNSASALSASAALTLEGIRFEMNSRGPRSALRMAGPRMPRTAPSGVALLSITNGSLRIAHCTFEAKAGIVGPEQAGIFLSDVHACRIENTFLFAPLAKAIVWQQSSGENARATQLTVTNCIANGMEVFWLDLRESPGARLEIVRSTFQGMTTFCVPASLAATNLEVDARQSVFHTGSIILDTRSPAAPPLPQWLRWREHENLHKPREGPERFITGATAPDGPTRMEDWNQWWNQTGANSRVVQLTFANGESDLKPGRPVFTSERDGYRITNLIVAEGPPLERDQRSRFGADVANVGPRSAP